MLIASPGYAAEGDGTATPPSDSYISDSNTPEQNVKALDAQVARNAADIRNNKTDIATNTKNITNNQMTIDANTEKIKKNTDDIAANTENIASNKTAIDINTKNITSNKAAIETNTKDIETKNPHCSEYGKDNHQYRRYYRPERPVQHYHGRAESYYQAFCTSACRRAG